jgi:RecA/RadA recombinase
VPSFQKPHSLKAALKLGLYGPASSGKSFTALLISEGLAQHTGKRVAYIDTEFGTAFYGQTVPQRGVHPDRFDFDVLHTKSITEVLAALKQLDLDHHGVLVVDSISHLCLPECLHRPADQIGLDPNACLDGDQATLQGADAFLVGVLHPRPDLRPAGHRLR